MAYYGGAHGHFPPPHRPYPAQRQTPGTRNGCAGCLFFPFTSGPRLARHLFAAKDAFGVADPKLRRLGMGRSVLGILATAAAAFFFSREDSVILVGMGAITQEGVTATFKAYLFGGVLLIVGIVVLAFRQRSAKRRHLFTALRTYALAWVPLLLFATVIALIPNNIGIHSALAFLLLALVLFALVFVIPWCIAFYSFCCFYLVRDMFRAGASNPLLAPVLSTLVPLVTFLQGLIVPEGANTNDVVPGWAGTVMTVAGIVSTLALATVEIRRLRRDHGISTKTVPPKREPADATPREMPPPNVSPAQPWGPPPPSPGQRSPLS